jgi:Tfp pilus assembly protein PilX
MNALKKLLPRDSGIALLTTMLLMLLMSSLLVGFIILITSGTKMSGYNNDYSKAFYGAEAGMEKMTADIGTLFDSNYAPTGTEITALEAAPPTISGINYLQASGSNGYLVNFPTDSNGNPLATTNTITSGAYEGMSALQTLYTLNVTARTTAGSEVKLQRTTQTVGIPIFQFGIFSQTDLSFFPGPAFSFGGRTATNGNLFLAANNGPLTLSAPVTAYLNVIRTNLSNGYSTEGGSYGGTVNVFNGSGTRALAQTEGSLVGTIGSAANSNWPTISLGPADYAGNLRNGTTGVDQLNLGIVVLGNGSTQPIDLIRRPVVGESSSVTALRYFAEASVRILLSDNPTDITSLPCSSGATPFNLATLAMPVANWTGAAATLRTAMTTNNTAGYNTPPVPLAASGAASGATAYSASGTTGNGYWLATPTGAGFATGSGLPIITGWIDIMVQTSYGSPCGSWTDVTQEVLSYGYAGRNINPNPTGANLTATQYGSSEPLLTLTATEVNPSTGWGTTASPCQDVHPNAIIRLERVRDNPSTYATTTQNTKCGVLNSTTTPTTTNQKAPAAYVVSTTEPGYPADYWPNTLFDAREGIARDITPTGTLSGVSYSNMVTLGGVMQYIEVDAKNLAAYLAGTGVYAGKTGHSSYDSVNAPNDYTLYISDRRGNYTASALSNAWPPLSPSGHETGEYGWDDFVNPANAWGCPNGSQDTGEDLDQLGTSGFYTYGANPTYVMDAGAITPITMSLTTAQSTLGYGQYGFLSTGAPGNLYGTSGTANAIVANPNCTVTTPSTIWPWSQVTHANEARENPNPFFRRAVKIVDGNLLTGLGTCPGSVPCGLAIATENPIYVQGDFNANSAGGGANWTDPNVAVSINADAVTFLSNNFNDVNSFIFPFVTSGTQRDAVTTYYRTAVMAGKAVSFPQPTTCGTGACSGDFGTDGGVHNFLRYIEDWGNAGVTLYYKGSIISMYYNRQAVGTYKDGISNTVYQPPSRGYSFDTEFLTPSLLPPRTPLFRDVNTTGFTQLLLPTQ